MSQVINNLITDPAYHDYLAILKGARNGFVYGVKVRFPHALVMTILFGRGSWRDRLQFIFRATKQHAFNLAKFVTVYKIFLLVQKKANSGKPRSGDTFIAGLLGAFLVFRERNAVNEQIVLYIVSRGVAALLPRSSSHHNTSPQSALAPSAVRPIPPDSRYFALLSAFAWGSVMWLFHNRGEAIQPGMFNSMTYIYRDSETWKDLRTLLWHNV